VGVAGYLVVMTVLSAALAVVQEAKIWKPKSVPSLSLYGCAKVFLFNIMWMSLCLAGSVLIVIKWFVTLGTSDIARDGNRWIECSVGKACLHCFVGTVKVVGRENLPPDTTECKPAPVFVANHASQIDVAAVYYIERRFKWIAKRSVVYLPGVGQLMFLSRHVFIDRTSGKNKLSVTNLFEKSNAAVQSGIPMFLFPQGTRRIAEKLPFKNGAFVVAQTNKSALIPISIEVPLNAWNSWYPLNLIWGGSVPEVKLTVHTSIEVNGKEDLAELKQTCCEIIYSVLPEIETEKNK
jgi:1-acyl-sn-glycerol-3-phosphate acyltransferase